MAIDFNKMKQKQKALENGGKSQKESKFWKVPDGKSTIRLLPDKDGDPLRVMHLHYDVSGKTVPCLKRNFNEKCPVCEFAYDIYKNKESSEAERQVAKKLLAKERYFSQVVVRDDGELEPKTWSYSPTVYKDLLALIMNEEYGDITDPVSGFDLIIDYGKVGGKQFAETKVTPKRKESKLSDDKQVIAKLSEHELDIFTLYEKFDASACTALLQEHLDKLEKATNNDTESPGGDVSRFGSDTVDDPELLEKKLAEFLNKEG